MTDAEGTWLELSTLLEGRVGWWLDDEGRQLWHFGLEGASRLNVTVVGAGRVGLFDAHKDDDVKDVQSIRDLAEWLRVHEHEYEGFTELQLQLMDHLLPLQIDEWKEDQGEA